MAFSKQMSMAFIFWNVVYHFIGNWFFLARVGIMQTRKVARLYIVHLE